MRKLANNNGTVTTYDYVNGVEYTNNTLERLPHTEGEIVKDGLGNYVYEYTLKDHLGNTRVTFGDADNNGIVENSDIKQINHYYPFGLNMEGPGFGAQGVNKYQFGEKELNTDFGLNWSDFGARWYQSDVPHFLNVDPMAEMYSSMSPYHYGKNSPMVYADPTGMMSEAYNFGMSGASGSAYDMYQRDAAISQSASGTARAANQSDFKASGSGDNIVWEGYRTSTTNTVTGFHFDCGCPNPPCPSQKPGIDLLDGMDLGLGLHGYVMLAGEKFMFSPKFGLYAEQLSGQAFSLAQKAEGSRVFGLVSKYAFFTAASMTAVNVTLKIKSGEPVGGVIFKGVMDTGVGYMGYLGGSNPYTLLLGGIYFGIDKTIGWEAGLKNYSDFIRQQRSAGNYLPTKFF